jgi:glycosyltransferase involved in cell wall biosynthesis
VKVAFVVPRYPPAVGGVEWHARMVATHLTELGVSIDVICTDPDSSAPSVDIVDGITVRRFPTVRHDATFFLSPSLFRAVDAHAHEYDLLHAHSYHTPLPLAAAIVRARRNVPLVCTLHYTGSGHTWRRDLLHVPYRPAAAWMLRRADAIICTSQAERDLLSSRFRTRRSKLTVIHNGIEPDEFRDDQPEPRTDDRTRVLYAGRIEGYKNTPALVRAVAMLPEFTLVIVGDGAARDSVLETAADVGLGDRLRMLGGLPHGELINWYRTADVFVSMSARESFGIALLEAAMAGARVVASDIPAHREVAGLLPEGAVTLVALQASDEVLARAITEAAARERVKDAHLTAPTWRAAAQRTLEVYQDVTARSRARTRN